MNDWRSTYRVYQGGLMRCCLGTLEEFMATTVKQPEEGDILHCVYHPDSGGMIFRGGAWHWNRPEDLAP